MVDFDTEYFFTSVSYSSGASSICRVKIEAAATIQNAPS